MEKKVFYSRVEKIVYAFSLNEIIQALRREWEIKDGKVSGEIVDDEGTIEITQIFEKKENKN